MRRGQRRRQSLSPAFDPLNAADDDDDAAPLYGGMHAELHHAYDGTNPGAWGGPVTFLTAFNGRRGGGAAYDSNGGGQLVPFTPGGSGSDDDGGSAATPTDGDAAADSGAQHMDTGDAAAATGVEPMAAPPAPGAGGGGTGGPPPRIYILPPSQTEPLRRWHHLPLKPEHQCHGCAFDDVALGAKKDDVVATKWLLLMKYAQRLASNTSLDNYQRAEKMAEAYNTHVKPVRIQVLERASAMGCAVDDAIKSDYHPLLAYEHFWSGHGHPSTRKRTRSATTEYDADQVAFDDDDDGVNNGDVVNNNNGDGESGALVELGDANTDEERKTLRQTGGRDPTSSDAMEMLMAIYSESIRLAWLNELYHVEKTADGQEIVKQDKATSAMIDKKAAVLMNATKLRQAELARRDAAADKASSSVSAAPSLTAATVLAKTAACSSTEAFGARATRDARPSDIELFRRRA